MTTVSLLHSESSMSSFAVLVSCSAVRIQAHSMVTVDRQHAPRGLNPLVTRFSATATVNNFLSSPRYTQYFKVANA